MKVKILTCMTTMTLMISSCNLSVCHTDKLGVAVSKEENREYSYTDKKAGYWYGTTHQETPEFWSGWNMAKKRILADYTLYANGESLNRQDAEVTVYPDRLERSWDNLKETFCLVDEKPVIFIGIESEESASISLDMTHLAGAEEAEDGIFYTPSEAPDKRIMLVQTPEGFILAYGTKDECRELVAEFRENGKAMLAARKARINSLVTEYNPVKTNLPELDKALDWITITMDELITEQQGNGIYAGLPWFNEYWGRDMFISMPGACLVTGQFDIAKQILKDFATLQDTDPASETYGRIPNRANLEGILYNTTDGTPRFVIQALEVAEYSGDTEFLHDLYPAITTSINASIKNYIDEKGYLTHADADTWMDVKRNGIPGSPRGNRANDIQALWYEQLVAGSKIAALLGDHGTAEE